MTWVNDGDVAHTVIAYGDALPSGATYVASGGFDSETAACETLSAGLVRAGERFEHTFEVAGNYRYVCIPHESADMTGTVTVRSG